MRHKKFGKFYKDPSQKIGNRNLWYSKDKAGHGGSKWKVFREFKKELKHFADTDATGKMLPKHKGRPGQIIEKKDLIGIK